MDNLERKIKRIKNLPQYKEKSEEELLKIAQEQIDQEQILGSLTYCVDEKEKDFAKNLLESYLGQSSFENFSERQILGQLIDQELLAKRLKEFMKKEYSKDNPTIPLQMVEQLDVVVERIQTLQEKLGLIRKVGEENSATKIIEELKVRFKKWINRPENRSNFTFSCWKCGATFLLRRRLDKEKDEIKEHPWFVDGGMLFNKQIFIDLTEGKITEEQAAHYLDCSIDYLQWILKEYPLDKEKKEDD